MEAGEGMAGTEEIIGEEERKKENGWYALQKAGKKLPEVVDHLLKERLNIDKSAAISTPVTLSRDELNDLLINFEVPTLDDFECTLKNKDLTIRKLRRYICTNIEYMNRLIAAQAYLDQSYHLDAAA